MAASCVATPLPPFTAARESTVVAPQVPPVAPRELTITNASDMYLRAAYTSARARPHTYMRNTARGAWPLAAASTTSFSLVLGERLDAGLPRRPLGDARHLGDHPHRPRARRAVAARDRGSRRQLARGRLAAGRAIDRGGALPPARRLRARPVVRVRGRWCDTPSSTRLLRRVQSAPWCGGRRFGGSVLRTHGTPCRYRSLRLARRVRRAFSHDATASYRSLPLSSLPLSSLLLSRQARCASTSRRRCTTHA